VRSPVEGASTRNTPDSESVAASVRMAWISGTPSPALVVTAWISWRAAAAPPVQRSTTYSSTAAPRGSDAVQSTVMAASPATATETSVGAPGWPRGVATATGPKRECPRLLYAATRKNTGTPASRSLRVTRRASVPRTISLTSTAAPGVSGEKTPVVLKASSIGRLPAPCAAWLAVCVKVIAQERPAEAPDPATASEAATLTVRMVVRLSRASRRATPSASKAMLPERELDAPSKRRPNVPLVIAARPRVCTACDSRVKAPGTMSEPPSTTDDEEAAARLPSSRRSSTEMRPRLPRGRPSKVIRQAKPLPRSRRVTDTGSVPSLYPP